MNEKLSLKITIISFFLMIGVVLAHSTNVSFTEAYKDSNWFIQQLYLEKLSNVIVTTFFFISGYLFFLSFKNGKEVQVSQFTEKINKRIKTLVIPYLFWSSFWFLFVYGLQLVPYLNMVFSLPLNKMSYNQQFYNLFLEPINYPFWFLRELILYVVFSPVLFLIIKYLKLYALIIFFIMALFSTSFITVFEVAIFKYLMLFFFLAGGYFAINSISLCYKVKPKLVLTLLITWIFLEGLLLFAEVNFIEKSWITKLITNLLIVLGCISCWFLYDFLDEVFHFKNKDIYKYGFIIYAVHGIPIIFFKKSILAFVKMSSFELFLFYVATFIVISLLSISFGMIFKKYFPKVYSFSTGNR